MDDNKPSRRTPLYEAHKQAGARLIDFAGWEMPVQYDGILVEHERVRNQVGLFDVSHMGEARVVGPDALDVVNRLISNDLNRVKDGRALYTVLCAEDGTIIDDLIVYRLSAEEIFICMNASNADGDFEFMTAHAQGDAIWTNESDDWAQIAVQGPHAKELLGRVFGEEVAALRPFRVREVDVLGTTGYIATTGYTGEAGGEIYLRPDVAVGCWDALMQAGQDLGVGPAGLGARDTLRLESAYCLYGNDIDRTTTPLEAGLGWVVRLNKGPFIGRDALVAQKEAGVGRKLVGIEVFERGIPRQGYNICYDGDVVGHITSGTKSPSTGRAIGLGYVPTHLAEVGSECQVDCRGRLRPARIVETPFYTRTDA